MLLYLLFCSLLGCPLIFLQSETKRNRSENEWSETAKQKVSFACFDLKWNGFFCMRNKMTQSKKYWKLVNHFVFLNSGIWLEYIVSCSQHKEHVATASSSIPYIATTLSSILYGATTLSSIPYVATTSSSITVTTTSSSFPYVTITSSSVPLILTLCLYNLILYYSLLIQPCPLFLFLLQNHLIRYYSLLLLLYHLFLVFL